jgi:putative restriction endonuclease
MAERVFGEITDYPEGSLFDSRKALSAAGVHGPIQAGISGAAEEGADSIVLSGGYEDDSDFGDEIVYTGHGGRDPETGQQVSDQQFTRGNAALARNKVLGLPVRVIRGAGLDSPYAPENGYRYDGLYSVDEFWEAAGKARWKVWRFRLIKIDPRQSPPIKEGNQVTEPPTRRQTITLRIVRDTAKSQKVKKLYDYRCQVCGIRLETPAGPYAEGAHLKPLGVPHNGPDIEANILCLCPNDHVLLDDGAITFTDDLKVEGLEGNPRILIRHEISLECIRYHREHFGALVDRNPKAATEPRPAPKR